MSVEAITWALGQRVGRSTAKFVLTILANCADGKEFLCFPSVAYIAEATDQDRKTVITAIAKLVEMGFVEDSGERRGSTAQIIVYRLLVGKNGTVKESHKRNSSKNGTVPKSPSNSTKNGGKQSRKRMETVPKTGHGTVSKRKEPSVSNSAPSSRVALHRELRDFELPAWLSRAAWIEWCEHREAKAADAPWTRGAARVSVKKLDLLRVQGQTPETTIEEALMRGWTGLFPVRKIDPLGDALNQTITPNWWKSAVGIDDRSKQLGIGRKDNENPERFKARVFKAAGPGEWMEEMLRTVGRESEERYEQLYAYFNNVKQG
ncbi:MULTISPECIES: helix-turn-helix domain-containing protein [Paraburkholderia]|uniref:helix-turn-helix domain-containing protein n=1 Tax=Paraburkholderia TaxID=1822464 RepID=UPI00224D60A0|nr:MULTISPECIES: helix-turn-helix domain-containing protein [Paraburkholderia]MCX4154974.1 helix-turn-helix domain-containing protein [Paraburkholderia aspalathi]MDN7164384.1 helix-turn-helix domain-containing protein [Paraburkholderia sp. SECH2]MDQ6392869.1 helix-turn-helix domain-containing protein [Paraburkholderia aspalathi]